jgi:chaperonin GroEL
VAVKAPEFGDKRKAALKDIAVATGATVFGNDPGLRHLKDVAVEDLGVSGEVLIGKNDTLLLKGKGKKADIDKRIEEIKCEIPGTKDDYDVGKLKERISRLLSGVAVVRVGGSSEVEVNEKKDRVTDALNATRAALEEGIVPGGGTALLRCIDMLANVKTANSDQKTGVDIVARALRTPCMTIAQNAGVDGSVVVQKVLESSGSTGYDVCKGDYADLMERGVVDPTKVVRIALSDATGVASLIATAEAVVLEMTKPTSFSPPTGLSADMM